MQISEPLLFDRESAFGKTVEDAQLFGPTKWPVLILGESGVGKERIAEQIHLYSKRSAQPMLSVNCGAFSESLFESELFGHEKGAFSGAINSNPGLIRQAHASTLFLDEIGELPLKLQPKLLRFLEKMEIRSVGSTRNFRADVRIIAATNRNLVEEAQQGNFRWDLLQRLSVLQIQIPALRDRKTDIAPIAQQICQSLNKTISNECLEMLCYYDWPGNIRQLKNLLIRATLNTSTAEIKTAVLALLINQERDLTQSWGVRQDEPQNHGTLAELEQRIILGRLEQCDGNKKATAKTLGIAKSTLHEKLRRWNGPTAPNALPFPISRSTGRPDSLAY